jgi:hypothetical protein
MALPSSPTDRALLGIRTALGISTLVTPRLASKAYSLDLDANPQLTVILRMGGVRNLALGARMYAATGANRAQWWRAQLAVDVLDFVAVATEWRRGAVPARTAALMAATALGAATLGSLSSEAGLEQAG